jgi:hypothetical protein
MSEVNVIEGNKKPDEFRLTLTKKKPKPNAPSYRIETIEQLFSILTEKNYKRFLKSLKGAIEINMAMKGAIDALVQEQNPEIKDSINVKAFTWTDD